MRRHYLSMDWRDALFAHWRIDPAVVDARLPPGVTARTHDGDAWLGVVAFVMEDIRPRGLPRALGRSFAEVNLRTYVSGPDGVDGIYFYNLDADDRLGVPVARRCYGLPYYRAAIEVEHGGAPPARTAPGPHERRVSFVSHRTHPGAPAAHVDAEYGPSGERLDVSEGSLERFLVENYRFYVAGDDPQTGATERGAEGDAADLFAGDVAHPPWALYEADLDLRSTDLFEANGFERPDGEPLAHYSPGVPVRADRVRRVE